MASTRLGYLAVKRQASANTAVKPTNFIRFKDGDIKFEQEIIANNPIQNNRWGALNAVKGKVNTSGTYNFDLDVNECVHWLSAALGTMNTSDISSETDASVYKHTITVANALPYLSVEQGKGNLTDTSNNRQNYTVERAFGVMVDELKLSGQDGIINMEVAVKAHGLFQKANLIKDAAAGSSVALYLDRVEGLVTTVDTVNIFDLTPQSESDAISALSTSAKTITIATLGASYTVADRAKVELLPQSPSYSVLAHVFSFIHASFRFGEDLTAAASASEENIEDWELTFMNNLEERYGSLRSSPSVIAPKSAKATLKYSKYFENVTDRDRYLDQIKRACILTITDDQIVSATDTGNALYSVVIKMSDVRFTTHDMPTGTDELYAISVEAECYYDATDGAAVSIEVINGQAGTVYTA